MRPEITSRGRHGPAAGRRSAFRAAAPWLAALLALSGAAGTVLAAGARDAEPAAFPSATSDTVPVFGPRAFQAGGDRPALYVERFRAPVGSGGAYVLRLVPDGGGTQPLRAVVRLNGATVVSAASLSGPVSVPVMLLSENLVELSAQGGGSVRLMVMQVPEPTFTLFGPRTFERRSGAPAVEQVRFVLPAGASAPYRLHVQNGGEGGGARASSAVVRLNGAQVLGPSDLSQDVGALLREVQLAPENVLEVELRSAPGSRVTLHVTGIDAEAPVIEITAPAPGYVTREGQVQVAGTVRDATPTRVTVNGVDAERTGDAFRATVPLSAEGNNTLTVTATDAAGNRADSVRTVVRDTEAPAVALLEPADGTVTREAQTVARGIVTDRTLAGATLNGAPVTLAADGSFAVPLTLAEGAGFVTLAASDRAGNTASVTHAVTLDTQAPVITVTAPEEGATTRDAEVAVTGRVEDATAVTLTVNGAPAAVGADGGFSATVALAAGANLIQLNATDAAGNAAALTRTVTREADGPGLPADPATVAPVLDRTVASNVAEATEFLYTGPSPIQTGVEPGAIAPVRASVVRGRVLARDGGPLGGAVVRVLDHPEFGQTLSRADGMFDLAVNGGGVLTLVYEKPGHLPANRTVSPQWQAFVHADDVVLVGLDPAVTAVSFDGASAEPQVARGSRVQDADGVRQATLVFDAGTEAVLEMPDGTTVPAGSLSIRATEYTVGESGRAAMPAALPPQSGYTYAVELSADEAIAAGAPHVRFSRPVALYLENFLEFPVGIAVPAGWYDREKAVWVPTDDGRVIAVTGITAGLAEVDTDGDGAADDAATLDALGIDAAERARLAAAYTPGQSLWRVQVDHFSWIDLNYPRGTPDGDDPDQDRPDEDNPEDDPCESGGSIIECENQVLGERVTLFGTEFSLSYRSDRVPGRTAGRVLDIPVSGASVPGSLRRIVVQVQVAGRTFTDTLPAAPNQRFQFVWDGKDAYGRTLQGQHTARVSLGYAYPFYYMVPASSARSFGLTCTPTAAGDYWTQCIIPTTVSTSARQEDIRWQRYDAKLGAAGDWDARAQALGGWTLDVHHAYDPVGRVLYMGDGARRSADNAGNSIRTLAGGAAADTAAPPLSPSGMALAPDGSIVVASYATDQVWRYFPDGRFALVAGNGGYGCSGDGGPAVDATLRAPDGVAIGPDGSIYIEDSNNDRIRRVAPDGTISTFAGQGQCADGGAGPGDQPQLLSAAAAPAGRGEAVPGDSMRWRKPEHPQPDEDGVRLLAADPGLGDGGPADQAVLAYPYGVSVAPDGSVYIADTGNNRIRRVTPDGIITTVAGNGLYGFGGDGGSAMDARLAGPWGITVGPDGSLHISDTGNHRMRKVSPDGVITTTAGNGLRGFSGDGGAATLARLARPADRVAFGPDGSVYIPDSDNYRIRRVSPDGVITTVAGNGQSCGWWETECGDGGPAAGARLGYMYDVMTGPDGDLYIADTGSERVRRVVPVVPGFTGADILIASEDGGELYHFDAAGRHRRTLNALTGAALYTFVYDAAGRLEAVRDGDGMTTRFERDAAGTLSGVVGPFGQRTAVAVDGNGFLSRIENAAGEAVRLEHTADGLLVGHTDPNGNPYAYRYDALGRLARDEDPRGGFQALSRAPAAGGFAVSRTTAGGRSTGYQVGTLSTSARQRISTASSGVSSTSVRGVDETRTTTLAGGGTIRRQAGGDPRFGMQSPLLRSVTVSTPGGRVLTASATRTTESAADAPLGLARQTERVTVNGRVTTTVYDAAQRSITRTSPQGRITTSRLDSLGRVVEVATPGFAHVSYTYDARGQLTEVRQGTRAWTYTYAEGHLATRRDPLGRTERFQRDAVGRVLAHTLANGAELRFGYDANGNLLSLTPPGREAYRFDPNAVDQVERMAAPAVGADSGVARYGYSLDRELTRITRADGSEVTFDYDAAGRVQAMNLPGGALRYTYDPVTGKLRSVATPDVGLALTYDGELPTASTWTGTVSGSVAWSYDNDFRVSSERVGGAHEVQFRYDGDGLLTGAGALTLHRDPANGLLRGTTVGGVSTEVSYDDLGEATSMRATAAGATVLQEGYTRDALGRIQQMVETLDGATATWGYGYDDLGRLTSVTRDGAPYAAYEYDDNGNRVRVVGPGGVAAGSYDAQDRVVEFGGARFGYTPNGELRFRAAGADTTWYEYDGRGTLTGARLPGGARVEYVLDGAGRRIGKKVGGALVQGLLYAGGPNPVAELSGSGAVVSRFVYGTRPNVPDYLVRGGQTYALVADHLGSVRRVVNASTGQVVQALDYDAWGQVIRDSNPGFQPFGYAGGLVDAHTGLVRFGARDYDSHTGRWTTRDPVGFAGGSSNLYAYALEDPVNMVDPDGLQSLDDFADFGAGFVDSFTFGLTSGLWGDSVDRCSGWYTAGEWAEFAASMATGVGGGLKAAGKKAIGKEFSHWIPDRTLKRTGNDFVRNTFGRSRLNGNYVTPQRHYQHDPYRYPRGWRDMGPRYNPVRQQYDRIPNSIKGGAAGAGYGAAGNAANRPDCNC
jgi:RHS repeat-associated protein